jgi:RNA polymerase sigma-70 factor, ECF subfamily
LLEIPSLGEGETQNVSTVAVPNQDFAPSNFPSRPKSAPQLVALARQGDQQAFFRLFEIHKRRVYSLSLRHLKNVLEAEGMTRQVFVSSFSKLNEVRDDEEFSACLTRTLIAAVKRSSTVEFRKDLSR